MTDGKQCLAETSGSGECQKQESSRFIMSTSVVFYRLGIAYKKKADAHPLVADQRLYLPHPTS